MEVTQKVEKYFYKTFPKLFWDSYKALAISKGLNELYLVLSFDCDRDQDISAADKISQWLEKKSIKSTFAVPGEQLKKGKETYFEISQRGSQFINHGFKPHALLIRGNYISSTFYHQMSPSEIETDIKAGHDICNAIFKTEPIGFRAPHFGLFQGSEQRQLQYKILESLNYQFSTSTVPKFSRRFGPAFQEGSLVEIPLSGSYNNPYKIFDSFGFLANSNTQTISSGYKTSFIQTVQYRVNNKIPGLLNFYVDPSHVIDSQGFFDSIEKVLDLGIQSLHYTDVLKILK